MLTADQQRAIVNGQIQQYEAEKYRLEIQLRIASKAHNAQAETQIMSDLITIEMALGVLGEELRGIE